MLQGRLVRRLPVPVSSCRPGGVLETRSATGHQLSKTQDDEDFAAYLMSVLALSRNQNMVQTPATRAGNALSSPRGENTAAAETVTTKTAGTALARFTLRSVQAETANPIIAPIEVIGTHTIRPSGPRRILPVDMPYAPSEGGRNIPCR